MANGFIQNFHNSKTLLYKLFCFKIHLFIKWLCLTRCALVYKYLSIFIYIFLNFKNDTFTEPKKVNNCKSIVVEFLFFRVKDIIIDIQIIINFKLNGIELFFYIRFKLHL